MITGVETAHSAVQYLVQHDEGKTSVAVTKEIDGQADGGIADEEFSILRGVADFFVQNPTAAEDLRTRGYEAHEVGTYSSREKFPKVTVKVTYPEIPIPDIDSSNALELMPHKGAKFTNWQTVVSLGLGSVLIAQGSDDHPDTVGRYDIHDGTRHQGAWDLLLHHLPDFGEAVRAKAADLVLCKQALPIFPDFDVCWSPEEREVVGEHDLIRENAALLVTQIDGNLNLGNGKLMTLMKEISPSATHAETEQARSELYKVLRIFFAHHPTLNAIKKDGLSFDSHVDADMIDAWTKNLIELSK